MAVFARIVAVHAPHLAAEGLDEALLQRSVNHKIVGSDTRLTCIERLAPDDTPRRKIDIGAAVDNTGTLAAELQHHGCQMLRRRTHHDTSQRRAARKEYHVITLLQQASVHLAVTLHDRYIPLVEGLGNHTLDRERHVRDIG